MELGWGRSWAEDGVGLRVELGEGGVGGGRSCAEDAVGLRVELC